MKNAPPRLKLDTENTVSGIPLHKRQPRDWHEALLVILGWEMCGISLLRHVRYGSMSPMSLEKAWEMEKDRITEALYYDED